MSASKQAGFTIIETVLFLAISGMLMAAIMAGTSASVSVQRYKDSVNSLQTVVQRQFSDTLNVHNERTAKASCDTNAAISDSSGTMLSRGQSECIVIGSYLLLQPDGKYTSYSVVGRERAAGVSGSEIDQLKGNYRLALDRGNKLEGTLEWGAQPTWAGSGVDAKTGASNSVLARTFAMLTLRSPVSGSVFTFTADTDQSADVSSMVTKASNDRQRVVCVASGDLAPGGRMAISITASATGTNSIGVRSNDSSGTGAC